MSWSCSSDHCIVSLRRLLIILLFCSSDHCIVSPSSTYDYSPVLLTIVLSLFVDFWLFSCSSDHCIVSPSSTSDYSPVLLTIVLSLLLRLLIILLFFWPLYCLLIILLFFWPLYCLSFFDFWLFSCSSDHCIVSPSSTSDYSPVLLTIVLSLLLRLLIILLFFWSLYCLSFFDFWLFSCSSDHCIVSPSSTSDYSPVLLTIVLSLLLRLLIILLFFWSLYCLSFFDLWLFSCSSDHCIVSPSSTSDYSPVLLIIVLSLLLRLMIILLFFWPLYCLSFFDFWLFSCSSDHCIVSPSSTYDYSPVLLTIVLSLLLRLLIILLFFWPLYCLSFFDLWLFSCSSDHCIVSPSSTSDYSPVLLTIVLSLFVDFWLFSCSSDHCIVSPSSTYDYSPVPLTIVLSLLLRLLIILLFFWPLYCLSFFDFWLFASVLLTIVLSLLLRLLIILLFFWPLYCLSFFDFWLFSCSSDHCIVSPSSTYDYSPVLLTIVLSLFVDFWLFSCSSDHCIVSPSSTYDYSPVLLTIVLSLLLRLLIILLFFWSLYCLSSSTSDYSPVLLTIVLSLLLRPLIILLFFWPLYCLSFFDFWLFSCSSDHCIVSPSSTSDYSPVLLTIVLSLLLRLMIILLFFWPLYCLSSSTSDYSPVLLTIVLSLLLRLLIILLFFWPLYCLSFFDFWLFSYSSDHCIVSPSSTSDYSPVLLTIVLSLLLRLLIILLFFWPLYCLSFFDFWCFLLYFQPFLQHIWRRSNILVYKEKLGNHRKWPPLCRKLQTAVIKCLTYSRHFSKCRTFQCWSFERHFGTKGQNTICYSRTFYSSFKTSWTINYLQQIYFYFTTLKYVNLIMQFFMNFIQFNKHMYIYLCKIDIKLSAISIHEHGVDCWCLSTVWVVTPFIIWVNMTFPISLLVRCMRFYPGLCWLV